MNAITFDTHAFIKGLTSVGFSEAQAEVVTSLVRRTREVDLADLATRADVAVLKAELDQKASKADLADVKADILKGMFGAVGFQTLVVIGALAALLKLLRRPP